MVTNRMIIVMLLWNFFILNMENNEQLRNDLTLYRKNVHDMLRATLENDVSYVEILTTRCCNINRPIFNYNDAKGKFWNKVTPLILATFYNCQEMVEFLIEKKVRLSLTDENGDTALHIAARTGRDQLVAQLLIAGADVSKKNKEGNTALQVAKNSLLRNLVVTYASRFENIDNMLEVAMKQYLKTYFSYY